MGEAKNGGMFEERNAEDLATHMVYDRPVDMFLRQPLCGICGNELSSIGDPYGGNPKKKRFKCDKCNKTYEVNQYEWPHLVVKGKQVETILKKVDQIEEC